MLPGIDPKKMQAMMKQMGIAQEEIDANRVVIERDEGNIVIENPQITKVKMQGNESFQITGDIVEAGEVSEDEGFSKEDIDMIIEKTGKSEEEVMESLEKTNDIAESILELSE